MSPAIPALAAALVLTLIGWAVVFSRQRRRIGNLEFAVKQHQERRMEIHAGHEGNFISLDYGNIWYFFRWSAEHGLEIGRQATSDEIARARAIEVALARLADAVRDRDGQETDVVMRLLESYGYTVVSASGRPQNSE